MNTTLKPALPTASQTTSANSPNKPMHPQGAPMSYSQPSGPIPQNSFPNTNMAHSHTSAQQNHFSLNSGVGPHFNMGNIPASNHPVANMSQSGVGQVYNTSKNVSYSSGFQHSLGQVQNQNTLPPVSQNLPATSQPSTLSQQTVSPSPSQNVTNSNPTATEPEPEKKEVQANGTPETKSQADAVAETNHVSSPAPQVTTEPQASQTPTTPAAQDEPAAPTPEKPQTPPAEEKPLPEAASKEPEETAATPTPAPSTSEPETPAINDATVQQESATENVRKESDDVDPLAMETDSTEDKPEDALQESKDATAADEDDDEVVEKAETREPAAAETAAASEPAKQKKEAASPVKLATIPRTPARKAKPAKPEARPELKTPVSKSPGSSKSKRQRMRTQHYQSPLPEIEIITKISSSTPRNRNVDDKLIYFYKNEFLAVRNAEGGFYLCQAVQNVYKSSSKIKIRWLSQDKDDKSGEIYTPDFYDLTDFDCILTSLDLTRVDKGKFRLKPAEKERTDSILKRCLAVEKGEIASPSLSEEHPDGLDLSLYKDEEQLKKKKRGTKRKASSKPTPAKGDETPTKKAPEAAKVRKVEAKPAKKPAKKIVVKKVSPPEVKKVFTQSSRAARGKRKSDPKTSPVVDQKKALVLARIGKKTAIPVASSRSQTTSKATKSSTPVSSAPKAVQSMSKVAAPSTSKTAATTSKTVKSTTAAAAAASSARASTSRKTKRSSRK